MLRPARKAPTQKAHWENPMNALHYIGFDIHKKTISFCVKTAAGDCCISHNARVHSDTPETIDDPVNSPTTTRLVGDSITKDYLPIINREAFGQIVARYQSLVCSLGYSATGSLSLSDGQVDVLRRALFLESELHLQALDDLPEHHLLRVVLEVNRRLLP